MVRKFASLLFFIPYCFFYRSYYCLQGLNAISSLAELATSSLHNTTKVEMGVYDFCFRNDLIGLLNLTVLLFTSFGEMPAQNKVKDIVYMETKELKKVK